MPIFQSKTNKRRRANYAIRAGDALAYGLKTSAQIRDIGPPPNVADPRRRKRADKSLEFFLKTYFPAAFYSPFSKDHRAVIRVLQKVATEGGLHAFAMPRGNGKTQIALRAALWSILTGRRRYVTIIGATERAAQKIIKALRTEISFNAALYADFPRELHGLPQLQGDNRKAQKQLSEGRQTLPRLGNDEIQFPTIAESKAAGAFISSCGLTGNIRGQFHVLKSGDVIRPDLVILDDPQTKESAIKPAQVEARKEIIEGDVLGLAGPTRTIAAAMPCTVIAHNDVADQMLKNALWHGVRTKTLYEFPTNMPLWDRYFERRDEELRTRGTTSGADQFYREHRRQLEAGAVVGWEHRKGDGEISAIQSAMHLWYRSPGAFAAEYQNEPIDAAASSAAAPHFRALTTKMSQLDRGILPAWTETLTAGIDIQKSALFYVVVAWGPDFTGSIVDYGAWPRQSRSYYTLDSLAPTLQTASQLSSLEAVLTWGLNTLTSEILARRWTREGDTGGDFTVARTLIDANWGESTETVYEFIRRSPLAAILTPSHGKAIKAGDRPMDQYERRPGETIGFNWHVKHGVKHRGIRHILPDVNFWKTFLARRSEAPPGEPGNLGIFGSRPEAHRLILDHLAAEFATETTGRGRTVWDWRARPGTDNHLLDALVLAGVAASLAGVALPTMQSSAPTARPRVKFSELQAKARARKGGRP